MNRLDEGSTPSCSTITGLSGDMPACIRTDTSYRTNEILHTISLARVFMLVCTRDIKVLTARMNMNRSIYIGDDKAFVTDYTRVAA